MGIYAGDGVARAAEAEAIRRVEREAEAQQFAQRERKGRNPGRKRERDEPAEGAEAVDLSDLRRPDRPEGAETDPADAPANEGAETAAPAVERSLDIEA